jgi:hypothetical protein
VITRNGKCVVDECSGDATASWPFLQLGRSEDDEALWRLTISFGVCATHMAFLEETFDVGIHMERTG